MPYDSDNDDDSNNPMGSGFASILRMAGVDVPSRAVFVGEAIVAATLSSLTVGFVCGGIGASFLPVGPLLPFLYGSSVGYGFGLYKYYQDCRLTMQWYAQEYPTVLAHALYQTAGRINSLQHLPPPSVVRASQEQLADRHGEFGEAATATSTMNLQQWIAQGDHGRIAWSLLAAQSCRGDIREIIKEERQRVVTKVLKLQQDDDDDNDEY